MSCQSRLMSSFIKEDEEILDMRDSKFSTNGNEILNWTVEIQLAELRVLFKDILLMITDIHLELNIVLKKCISLLDELLKQYDNSILTLILDLERVSITSQSNSSSLHQVNEMMSLINSLFKANNLYILYSKTFRKFFQIETIFDNRTNKSASANDSFSKEIHKEGSYKSILENLLT